MRGSTPSVPPLLAAPKEVRLAGRAPVGARTSAPLWVELSRARSRPSDHTLTLGTEVQGSRLTGAQSSLGVYLPSTSRLSTQLELPQAQARVLRGKLLRSTYMSASPYDERESVKRTNIKKIDGGPIHPGPLALSTREKFGVHFDPSIRRVNYLPSVQTARPKHIDRGALDLDRTASALRSRNAETAGGKSTSPTVVHPLDVHPLSMLPALPTADGTRRSMRQPLGLV